MKTFAMRATIILGVLALGAFALAGTASASHVTATVSVVQQASVGQPADVQVTLRSPDGNATLTNIPVTFYTDASLGDVKGEVVLGRSVTDNNGVASLNFEPRVAGEHQIRVEFAAPGETQPQAATTTISVAGGTTQLYQSTAGIQIPGLSVWLLIAVLSAVWLILLSVALRVLAIARDGSDAESAVESAPRPRQAEARPIASSPGVARTR
jgi:hypothetical protein